MASHYLDIQEEEVKHRSYEDIVEDLNRVVREKTHASSQSMKVWQKEWDSISKCTKMISKIQDSMKCL